MKKGILPARFLLLVGAAALFAGCAGSPSSRFYTLTPLASHEAQHPAGEATKQLVINVEPVEIPDYLDRPQIVTREGRNEVKLAEIDRWAGSLGDNISAVLAENLALLLGTNRVFVNPGLPLAKTDYDVVMRVLRLDLLPGDHVLLKAQWALISGDSGRGGPTHLSSVTEKLTDNRYDTLVAGVNRAVETLSREIAKEIPQQMTSEASRETPAK